MIHAARLLLVRARYYYIKAKMTRKHHTRFGIFRPEEKILEEQYLKYYRECSLKLQELLYGSGVSESI